METIAEGEVPFAELNVSDSLLSLLKMTLEKDPEQRAGVGDCLQHPFLQGARKTRIAHLSEEFMLSHKRVTVGEDDIRAVSFVMLYPIMSNGLLCPWKLLSELTSFSGCSRRFKLSHEFLVYLLRVQPKKSRSLANILPASPKVPRTASVLTNPLPVLGR